MRARRALLKSRASEAGARAWRAAHPAVDLALLATGPDGGGGGGGGGGSGSASPIPTE